MRSEAGVGQGVFACWPVYRVSSGKCAQRALQAQKVRTWRRPEESASLSAGAR